MTRRRDCGLTLLEVLVATALLAVFFASVYTLVASTVVLRNSIEDSATPYAVGPAVMDCIVRDLRGATIEPYVGATRGEGPFHAEVETVNGDPSTKVDFITAVPSRARVKIQNEMVKAWLNEVGYRVRRSETANGLLALYRREDLGVDEDPLAGGKYYKLADRVRLFKIEWFPEDPGDPSTEEAKGDEEWDVKKETKLPWGCRISLTLVGEARTDDSGRPVEDAPEYPFVTCLVFASRHDAKPEPPKQP